MDRPADIAMNPHTHLIRFTTAIGAGYGLLACMAMFAIGGVVPEDRWFGVVGFGLAPAGAWLVMSPRPDLHLFHGLV